MAKLCDFQLYLVSNSHEGISSAMRTLRDYRSTCERSFFSQTRFWTQFVAGTPTELTKVTKLCTQSHKGGARGIQRSCRNCSKNTLSRNLFSCFCFKTVKLFLFQNCETPHNWRLAASERGPLPSQGHNFADLLVQFPEQTKTKGSFLLTEVTHSLTLLLRDPLARVPSLVHPVASCWN